MELIEGQPLSDYINSLKEKGQRLIEGQIWRLFIEMCAGLRYLHLDKKVVHRDLTPSNIMITRNLHVKIADFGLAKQRGVTHSTGHGNGFVGTIQYASPEVIQNNPYGDKADIWALGCILYELATLKPAFSGENPLAIARRVVEEDYDRLSPKEFSPLLITVVSKCMTVNQDNRPDILQLSQMIGPILMLQVDELKAREQRLQDQLRKDRLRGASELTPVTLKTQSIKKISDPMGALLTTIHKLIYISQQPPGLQRDSRRSNLESFKHWLFSDPSGSDRMKEEIRKFHNCMREEIPILSVRYT
jgi:NIMA (never in mitosis gene a)-related kinase